MLVGEAPGEQEVLQMAPFVGRSGEELNRMLGDAGILRSECFTTNLCRIRPQDNDISHFIPLTKKAIHSGHVLLNNRHVLPVVVDGYNLLMKEIAMVQPNVILAFGNAALWALTGKWGVMHWRGSTMGGGDGPVIVPVIHPAAVLRQWDMRQLAVQDMRRAATFRHTRVIPKPKWNFILRPSYHDVVEVLQQLIDECNLGERWIDFDIETPIPPSYIECVGISWSRLDALCIPFAATGFPEGYFLPDEEAYIVWLLYKLLTHKNVRVRGQNLLFDCQVVHRYWHFIPRVAQDTMLSHHILFAGMRKKLDLQASMYCSHYVQWKPEKRKEKEGG